jgi:hypothetical protein
MTAWITLPQNSVVTGQSGHLSDHDEIYGGLLTLWTAAQQSVYNVCSPTYGADPTGAADSTTAIQNAINAAQSAGGGVVYFPAGTYLVTPSGSPAVGLTVSSNSVRFAGAGAAASILKKTAAGTLLSFTGTTSPSTGSTHVRYCGIENLGLSGNGQTGSALQLYYVDNFYARDMQVTSNSDLAIDCVEFWDSRFYNMVVVSCSGSVSSTTQPAMWIRNASAASGVGSSTGNSNNVTLTACRFEAFGTGALWVSQGTSNSSNPNNIKVIGCKFEGDAIQGGPAVQFDNSTKSCIVDDCHVQIGGFAGGFSIAQVAISLGGGDHILSNCVIGNNATATISNGVFLHAVGGTTIAVENVIGHYTTAPTTAHVFFDASATGSYSVDNIPTEAGTQLGGTPPASLKSVLGTLALGGGTNTAASVPVVTPTFASGTAAQLSDTTRDYMVYFTVGTAGTITLALGPTSGVANTLINAQTATAGELISFRLPAGWFVKVTLATATITQKAIGC